MNQLQTLTASRQCPHRRSPARQSRLRATHGDHRITAPASHAATDGCQHKHRAPVRPYQPHPANKCAFITDGFSPPLRRARRRTYAGAPSRRRQNRRKCRRLRFVALASRMLRRQYQRHRVVFVMLQSPAGSRANKEAPSVAPVSSINEFARKISL